MDLFNDDQQKALKSIWIPWVIYLLAEYVVNHFSSGDLLWIDESQYQLLGHLPIMFLFSWDMIVTKKWAKLARYAGVSLVLLVGLYMAGLNDYNETIYTLVLLVAILVTRSLLLHGVSKKLLAILITLPILWTASGIELWHLFPRMEDTYHYNVSEKNGLFFFLSIITVPAVAYVTLYLSENITTGADYIKRYRDKAAVTDVQTFVVVYIAAYTVMLKACIFLAEAKHNFFIAREAGAKYMALDCVQWLLALALIAVSMPVWWRVIIGRMLTTTRNSFLLLPFHMMPVFNLLPFFILFISEDVNTTRAENVADYMGLSRKIPVLTLRILFTLLAVIGLLYCYRAYVDEDNDNNAARFVILSVTVMHVTRILLLWVLKKTQLPIPFYVLGIVISFSSICLHYLLSSALIFDLVLAISFLMLITEIFDPKIDERAVEASSSLSDQDLVGTIGDASLIG